jgi:predicted phage tail protein
MSDELYNQIVEEFKRAGWIMGVLGALGMVARLVFTNEKFAIFVWGRKVFAASIVGLMVFFSMYETGISEMYKSVICSVSGSFAPELFEFVKNKVLAKLSRNE